MKSISQKDIKDIQNRLEVDYDETIDRVSIRWILDVLTKENILSVAKEREVLNWQPMETAPKDGTLILGFCVHDADPYFLNKTRLTTYGSNCEALGHVCDGPHVIQWGGEDVEYDEWQDKSIKIPPWWFRYGSDFEDTANPIRWMSIPKDI